MGSIRRSRKFLGTNPGRIEKDLRIIIISELGVEMFAVNNIH